MGPKRLTKFEKVRIISVRAQQIATGSPIFLEEDEIPEGLTDPIELAKLELEKGRLPIIIRRSEGDRVSLIHLKDLLKKE
ncbi:MAG: DNA-directed RNA polymerase subunit omega [Candidatus Korarchaeum sp.]|nr:DNA-directed RNA polymerase subunit omega [Candidatus Korarchaeum sp.]MDW8035128.1 DNA-directed RNA polymerase subunit omega [Candidatus Korarchaeum sp.]